MKKLLYIWVLFFTMFTTVIHADITTGLVAHYKFENNVNDSTVNDNNGTIVPSTGNHVSYVNGVNGKAIFLNESAVNSDYIEIPLASKTWVNGMSVCTWANFQGSNRSWERIFEFFGGTTNQRLTRDGSSSDVSTDDVGILGTVDTDTFHHYCITYGRTDATTATKKAYRDGQYIGQATGVSLPSATAAWTTYRIGGSEQQGGDYNFYGYIDDFRVYDRLLSDIDVIELYNIPKLTLKAHGGALQISNSVLDTSGFTAHTNQAVTNFTIEWWMNPSAHFNTGNTIGYGWGSFLFHDTTDGGLYVGINGDSDSNRLTPSNLVAGTLELNKWQHFAFTFDASNGAGTLYKNGVALASKSAMSLPATFGDFVAGKAFTSGLSQQFALDEVRVWNIARTGAEIKASMNHQLEGNETGLLAYYNFDERIGTTVKDIAGNGNNAIMEGNVTRLNFLGDGLKFSGTNTGINTNVALSTQYTKQLWLKIQSGGISNANFLSSTSDYLWFGGEDGRIAASHTGTGSNDYIISTNRVDDNLWHNIATTYDEATLKLYVDGQLVAQKSLSTLPVTTNPIYIGSYNVGPPYSDGAISEVSLWDRALSQTEIQKLMLFAPSPSDANLTGYWPLNEGAGTTAYDYSLTPHTGTISGATWINTTPTIYGNNIYTNVGITAFHKLTVENNTSTPTYSYNGNVPSTITDFNGTTGAFIYYSQTAANETLNINASDGGVNLNSLFKVTVYPTIYFNINIPSLNLNDFNITSIRAYTPEGAIEDLYLYDYYGRGGSNSITNGADNNYSAPIYFPNNNFAIEVNGTFFNGEPQSSSWYYNFNDGKLYPDINSTTDFKTEINATNNTFTINTYNREYYTFTGNLFENDNNVTNIVLMSNDIGLGYHGIVAQGATSYSVMYSELGAHTVFLFVDGNTSTSWYYNFETGDINSTYQSTPSTIDTSTVKSFDLNLSSAHFSDYSSVVSGTTAPTISHVYDRFRTPNSAQYDFNIVFDVNDTDSATLILTVTTDNNNTIDTASFPVNSSITANQTQLINIVPTTATSVGNTRMTIILSDGITTVHESFNVNISNTFDIIATKEANVSGTSFDADYNGTLYAFSSNFDNNITVEYEKLKVINSLFDSNLTTIKDINGTVTVTTKANTIPAPFQYASTNLGSGDLSAAYSYYGTPFEFSYIDETSTGTKVYVTYPDALLESYASDMRDQNGSFFTSINSFMNATIQNSATQGIRNHARNKLLVFNQNEIVNSNGTLIELDENGSVLTAGAGTWEKITVNSQEVLLIHPTAALATANGYNADIAFVLDSGIVKSASYKASGDIYSYILLDKAAKDALYHSISPNPKITKLLNSGYTYISLPSSKTLCDEDVQSYDAQGYIDSCDQRNTLESVFGVNSNIDLVFKFGREWMYWDNNQTANPLYSLQKFSAINPLEGIMVKTSAATSVNMPFDEDSEAVNDYTNLFATGWTLMSNNKAQTVGEISTALTAKGKELVYILLLRDNVWQVYAPTNNSAVNASIPRLTSVNRYESFWVYFR
ncbi:MAG: LamG domain-containing protein [Sulfurimonas sp.]|jgi:hypothetical protein